MDKSKAIRAYKVFYPGDRVEYSWYDYSTQTAGNSKEFEGLVRTIKNHVSKEGGLYTITFSPPCEMSCPPPDQGKPFLCVPFNAEEKLDFFQEYTAVTGEEQ